MSDYLIGSDYLSNCVIGMYDIGEMQKRFNTFKQMSVGMARAALKGGQGAINGAIAAAIKKPTLAAYFFFPVAAAQMTEMLENGTTLPRGSNRKNVWWKLKWHEDQLAKGRSDTDVYEYSDDLKKWIMEAFIESNAVEEGRQYVGQVYDKMWDDIWENMKNLPKTVRNAIGDTVEWWTGVPLWAWGVGGVCAIGVAGFGVYKIALAAAPAVAGAVTSTYLPRR